MPYKGGRRKKKYTHKKSEVNTGPDGQVDDSIPRSVIYHNGASDPSMVRLIRDWRRVFLPNTMAKLRVKNTNKMKDYVALAGPLGLTHLHIFGSPDFGATMRLARLPRGPTILLRVESYCTMKDVVSPQRRQFTGGTSQYMSPPLVILNGFGNSPDAQVILIRDMLQSLVPNVTVDSALKLNKIQRVLLFQYLTEGEGAGMIEVRHYYITARSVGLARAIQKLKDGRIPKTVGTSDSFSDVLTQEGLLSDTDGEGEEVSLPQDLNFRKEKGRCRVKLVEMGPRMTWQPIRVEAGLCEGEVLWHQFKHKTEDEIIQLHENAKKKERLKRRRSKEQKENVERKQKLQKGGMKNTAESVLHRDTLTEVPKETKAGTFTADVDMDDDDE